jgi:hypothetical protein
MVENLTSLGITPNEIDSDVGEDGEEDEDDELCHRDDCNGELRFLFNWRLILFRWAFVSSLLPRADVNVGLFSENQRLFTPYLDYNPAKVKGPHFAK